MLRGKLRVAFAGAVLVFLLSPPQVALARGDAGAFTLTILHNNDGESSLLPTAVDTDGDGVEDTRYGGIARFQRKVDVLRIASYFSWDPGESLHRGVVLLNSGDNYLAGTTFQASEQEGAPFYDGIAVALLRYDALAVGNHEFDFGPSTFRRFVQTVFNAPFVSANLDYSGEPALRHGLARKRTSPGKVARGRVAVGGCGVPISGLWDPEPQRVPRLPRAFFEGTRSYGSSAALC